MEIKLKSIKLSRLELLKALIRGRSDITLKLSDDSETICTTTCRTKKCMKAKPGR